MAANEFIVNAWPPNGGVVKGFPLEEIPEGAFSDSIGFVPGGGAILERAKAPTQVVPSESDEYKGVFYFQPSGSTSRLLVGRTKTDNEGIYYYVDSAFTKVRGGTCSKLSMCQFMDKFFVAGFTDTDGAFSNKLQLWDGTYWRLASITRPTSMSVVAGTGGDLTNGKYYRYSYTFVDSDGNESAPYSLSTAPILSGSNNKFTLTITAGAVSEGIAKRKIYRTLGKDTEVEAINAPKYYLTEIADNTTLEYEDTDSDDELNQNIAQPVYNNGWDGVGFSLAAVGTISAAGRVWAWSNSKVAWSGRPPALTEADTLSQASTTYGLNEPYYWHDLYQRYPGDEGDRITNCIWWGNTIYALKENSVWRLNNSSIDPISWTFVKVSDVGAASKGCTCSTADGIYFISYSGGYPTVYFFNGNSVTDIGRGLFDVVYNAQHIFSWLGRVFVSCDSGTYCYDPDSKRWSKFNTTKYTHSSMYYSANYNYLLEEGDDGDVVVLIQSHLTSVRTTGMVTGAYLTTGNISGGSPEMPKRFSRLRFQVSTSGATTVTVTAQTDNTDVGEVQVYTGSINASGGDMIDVNIPKSIAQGRYIKLKFAFSGSYWARLDGWSLYGERLPFRKNL